MKFGSEGPFEIPRIKAKILDSSALAKKELWSLVDQRVPNLSEACGCYVFAIRTSRGILPWYVGKAERQSFKKECLTHHKISHYNSISALRKGTPVIYLLPQLTSTGKHRKPTVNQRPAIRALESLLIGMAVSRNPDLANIKGTKWFQNIEVEGFLNSRKSKKGSGHDLRKIFSS